MTALTLPSTGSGIAVDTIAAESHQLMKMEFGAAGTATQVSAANPLPIALATGKNRVTVDDTQADIHGQLVGVTRITQITTKFFQQAPASFLNVTLTGGATATGPTAGAAVFATSTAVTASLLAQTPIAILYAAQYEAWAVLSGAFTAPTSAASFQRLGIYDTTNGYSFGYNGLTFGVWVRVNSVDTFIAQTAWNRDVLSGAATSLFTSNNTPVALTPANLNMFRVRFGWYGGVTAVFEVYAPDGNWVAVHQSRTVNSQASVNMTVPDLPMTVEVSKTASDATNLAITCGGWAAGITAPLSGLTVGGQKSIAALNSAVSIPLSGLGKLSLTVTGTWVGTLAFQTSQDGLNWTADAPLSGTPAVFTTSTTTNITVTSGILSGRFYRVVATAWTSGTASIAYFGAATNSIVVSQSLITDGNNNGPVAVKPASTAAVATDAAAVVALSPNSPLPAGTNLVGDVNARQFASSADVTLQNAAVALANGAVLPTTGYGSSIIGVIGTFVATVSFEGTIDNTNYFPVAATQLGASAIASTATAPGLYRSNVVGLTNMRARISAYTSGSITVVSRATNATNASKFIQLVAGTNSIGNINTVATVSTVSASTPAVSTTTAATLSSAATTNATLVKASAGNLYSVTASNVGAAAAFLKVFNLATAPTVGTSVPFLTIPIAPSGVANITFGTQGMRMSTGISFSITNLVADADATVIAAAQVKVAVAYI